MTTKMEPNCLALVECMEFCGPFFFQTPILLSLQKMILGQHTEE